MKPKPAADLNRFYTNSQQIKAKYSVLNDGYFSQGEDDADYDFSSPTPTQQEEKREKPLSESYKAHLLTLPIYNHY
jgi:hypothetical protein